MGQGNDQICAGEAHMIFSAEGAAGWLTTFIIGCDGPDLRNFLIGASEVLSTLQQKWN